MILTIVVYANGRQFKNKKDLKEEKLKQWPLIKPLIKQVDLSNHVKLMTDRVTELLQKNDGTTKNNYFFTHVLEMFLKTCPFFIEKKSKKLK